jgi:hypothetical protein
VNPEEPTRVAAAVTRERRRRRPTTTPSQEEDEDEEDEGAKHEATRKTGVQKQGLDALTRAA